MSLWLRRNVYQIPRGTRDFIPEEMYKRRYLQHRIEETFRRFGYGEIQTPTFETLELFTAKSGSSIIDELYNFTDKGGRELALRPELTAPVIRCYIERLQMAPKPLKLFYFGNCFRYDRPQKGRYREFWQAGCELIGTDTPEAHAELVALAYSILCSIGLRDIVLNIGNLHVIAAMFRKVNITDPVKRDLLTFVDKSQYEDLFSALRANDISQQDTEAFIEILQTPDIDKIMAYVSKDEKATAELTRLRGILGLLQDSFGITDAHVKIGIVRGLDYYKGLVFEIEAPILGAEKQLCGGGDYELVSLFGGTAVPQAGFAIGFDRALLALETEQFSFPKSTLDVYIVPVNEDAIPTALTIAAQLRAKGLMTDLDLVRRGISKSLKYAASQQARFAVIIGPKELETKTVTLRNMADGTQTSSTITDLPSKIC
jgi:histidyl-tRNA synthetase